ncbi:MAG: ABC transporter substrate-binding protein [Gaiellaceae bacterium]
MATVLIVSACGGGSDSSAGEGSATEGGGATTEPKRVAIFEIVQLDIIDDLVKGFKENMAKEGFVEGDNVTYETFNAQGETTNCNTIASQLAQGDWDLVYVVGTSCVQALYQKRPQFPIVFGAMTDPIGAGMAEDFDHPNPNSTGTTDLVPPDKNLDFLKRILPDMKTVGTLGNPTEANTESWMKLFKAEAVERGLKIVEVPVQSTNDVQIAANSLANRVDVIIAPPDNTVEPAIGSVIRVALERKVPLLTAKAEHAEKGALIGMGVDYYQIGLLNGTQGAKILNGATPESMPVEALPNPITNINLDTATEIGVQIPDDVRSAENVNLIGG